jgi:hypothetical protein
MNEHLREERNSPKHSWPVPFEVWRCGDHAHLRNCLRWKEAKVTPHASRNPCQGRKVAEVPKQWPCCRWWTRSPATASSHAQPVMSHAIVSHATVEVRGSPFAQAGCWGPAPDKTENDQSTCMAMSWWNPCYVQLNIYQLKIQYKSSRTLADSEPVDLSNPPTSASQEARTPGTRHHTQLTPCSWQLLQHPAKRIQGRKRWMRWHTPVIPALERLRQEDCKFQASLHYITRPPSDKTNNKNKF